jgi:hypothetical protein
VPDQVQELSREVLMNEQVAQVRRDGL